MGNTFSCKPGQIEANQPATNVVDNDDYNDYDV